MLPRAITGATLIALVLAAPAFAAKPKPRTFVIPIEQKTPTQGRIVVEGSSMCELGINGDPLDLLDYIIPPDDTYYTLLQQSDCDECPEPAPMKVAAGRLMLAFSAVPCSVFTEVSLVRATGSAQCRAPSVSQVICGPFTYTLVAPPSGDMTIFDMPVPQTCGFSGNAFLKIVIQDLSPGCAADGERPLLVAADYCDSCSSYNLYGSFLTDLCGPESGLPGNPVMYADMLNCALADAPDAAPMAGVELGAGFPNPAPAGVTIRFQLPRAADATLRIFDVSGSLVKTLASGQLEAGAHSVKWDRSTDEGRTARPGIYFYELDTGGTRIARRVVMLK